MRQKTQEQNASGTGQSPISYNTREIRMVCRVCQLSLAAAEASKLITGFIPYAISYVV